jgi:hypothetical protein
MIIGLAKLGGKLLWSVALVDASKSKAQQIHPLVIQPNVRGPVVLGACMPKAR